MSLFLKNYSCVQVAYLLITLIKNLTYINQWKKLHLSDKLGACSNNFFRESFIIKTLTIIFEVTHVIEYVLRFNISRRIMILF